MRPTIIAALGLTAGLLILAGCTGSDGADGPQGPPGAAAAAGPTGATGPAGPTGATGPTGPSGVAGAAGAAGAAGSAGTAGAAGAAGSGGAGGGGLPTGCLSPCHGFNGIVEQWKTSTHFATYVSNLGGDEVATWTGATACGNCHAVDALEQRVAGNVKVADGGVVANLASGELGYRNPANNAYSEAVYGGNAKIAAVNCTTCHSVTNDTDPHKTGLPYAPGSFPLRVPTGTNDPSFIEKSADTSAVSGTAAGNLGTSNTCAWCHRSRKDVTNYITASVTLTSANWGPHEGPQTDVYSAKGGYQYPNLTYGTSTHEQKLKCVDCHMPSEKSNGNAPNHSFYPKVSACTQCHADAKNFDISGGESQIKASLAELQKALNDAGYLTRSESAPYVALTKEQLADGQFAKDKTRPGAGPDGGATVLTADQAGAVYNYLLVARGSGFGVHNPKYTRQLIFDSYTAIAGKPPTTLVRPQ